ncbi:hypothetical protein Nepgr_023006 [Nepenthes gracilis]|uniref:Uncharacterized protein n=1 Tax=Nepenthes gracilis TaxID=150966 RepID=A0AAD3XYM3_NEPGR|nr:hypothetical protein Nepgr_023006 [Nepenthes gracilis]
MKLCLVAGPAMFGSSLPAYLPAGFLVMLVGLGLLSGHVPAGRPTMLVCWPVLMLVGQFDYLECRWFCPENAVLPPACVSLGCIWVFGSILL